MSVAAPGDERVDFSSGSLAVLWMRLRRRLGGRPRPLANASPEPPATPVELFSAEQMEAYGMRLARAHLLDPRPGADRLLNGLATNEQALLAVARELTAAIRSHRRIAPAGVWLLDNFYLIEEQIRTAKRHLPKGYSRSLPRLAGGASAGLPRVYEIAREAIAHGDGRVDPDGLSRFLAAYQTVTVLDLGELWAIPIMLRLALIDNLRIVGVRVAADTREKEHADTWADWMMDIAKRDPKSLILAVADMARSNPPMASAFVAELARRLQGRSAALALPLTWIEQRLAETGLTIEQLVQLESRQQAAGQVSISNSIASLRLLAAMDWRTFVESLSGVERVLRQDPAGVYPRMDFRTRDMYRHEVERYARAARKPELEIAELAVELAREGQLRHSADAGSPTVRQLQAAHLGEYLVGAGRRRLETLAGVHLSRRRLRWPVRAAPALVTAYLSLVLVLTLLLAVGLANAGGLQMQHGAGDVAMLVLVLLAAGELVIALVNWLVTVTVPAHSLPRLDFSRGIAPDCRTLVVVPSMLGDPVQIDRLCDNLEVHFLANRDAQLQFALLTDFADAGSQCMPGDDALRERVRARITALNARHCGHGADSFLLFHRPRTWNPRERAWMGHERKRGKLGALNALLRGGDTRCFELIVGDLDQLPAVRYVITLDSDTGLPRDAAQLMVGAMAHPLNLPVVDQAVGRVISGYGILQPRLLVCLPNTCPSRYARLLGDQYGIDPYTRAVSDVYQDLFGEGSFIGKGIYDVDAFQATLADRLPENRILSHDLLEGCYARSGLLSDAILVEAGPVSYSGDVARRRRWIRGDWQIASWALARVPGTPVRPASGSQPNPLSALSRWKILDNLRRSLTPAALVALLTAAWTIPAAPLLWSGFVVAVVVLPTQLGSFQALLGRPPDLPWRLHVLATLRFGRGRLWVSLFAFACLLHEACYGVEAALRSSWRILVSRRHLLEWVPSGGGGSDSPAPAGFPQAPWSSSVLSVAIGIGLALHAPTSAPVALPLLLLWFFLPTLCAWLDLPPDAGEPPLSPDQRLFLRRLARQTWSFFEHLVGPDDHWLPPDNFQEYPAATLAHRTSPTNIGLALLSSLAAHDLGFLNTDGLCTRVAGTLATLSRLPRHAGHFYNWYDTLTLEVLPPAYVSTVDSGNLAGHLLTLASGLRGLPAEPVLSAHWREGLRDGALVLLSLPAPSTVDQRDALARVDLLLRQLEMLPLRALRQQHTALCELAPAMTALRAAFATGATDPGITGWLAWADALAAQRAALDAEFDLLLPWLARPPPGMRLSPVLAGFDLPTLVEVEAGCPRLAAACRTALPAVAEDECRWLQALETDLQRAAVAARQRRILLTSLAEQAASFARPDFGFLYDGNRRLLAIGANIAEHRRDPSYYDMLASEARLGSFVAVAQGQLPQEHWFALGRLLTRVGGDSALLSWSGSMFEYLMPLLVMPGYANSLLDRTHCAVVQAQIDYAAGRGVPWGISESGYNAVDVAMNYQYRAFGVPGLGLKPGLAEDLVIAPYASALALLVSPLRACLNLQRLDGLGASGRYGLHEAIDYTPVRVPRHQASALVQSFMAHHQGMVLLAIDHVLADAPMQRRFMADPAIQATLLLLQERVPRSGAVTLHVGEFSSVQQEASAVEKPVRVIRSPSPPAPEVQLLSNGRYHVMLSQAGGGYSRWNEIGVTRWSEDPTRDHCGAFCYLRDLETGRFWSNTWQPTLVQADSYVAIFSEGRAEFRRTDLDFETHTEVVVSPEDDIELRRLHISNRGRARRLVEVTSYAEVVLAIPLSDALHPAFGKLFIQTEVVPERHAILCSRRPRSRSESTPWMVHMMAVRDASAEQYSYETDRDRFIGRGGSTAAPAALRAEGPLSGSAGSVLDPVVAIRRRVVVEPEQTVIIDLVSGMAATRAAALAQAGRYQDRHLADRAFDLAWTHSQVVLRQINSTEADAQLYAQLAAAVLYANPALRADPAILARNQRGQSGLWGYAISGDLPLVLVQISDPSNIGMVRQMVQAHAYWRLKGLPVDLVIWNEDQAGYRQQLQEQIVGLIASGAEAQAVDKPGGIFVRRTEQMPDEDRVLIQSVARVIVNDRYGALRDQLSRQRLHGPALLGALPGRLKASRQRRDEDPDGRPVATGELQFDNGLGGFSADGTEYVIRISAGEQTPAPWVNVIANAGFGTVISESGAAYTWSENAHEYRLSPWSNDPVADTPGEAFYLRDEESGHFWSPTLLPSGGTGPHLCRHGFGYSSFEHVEDGIASELTVHVALGATLKFSVLTVENRSSRARVLSATGYVEWVLGDLRAKTGMHVVTEVVPGDSALYACNPYNSDFAGRVAFFDVDCGTRTFTADRGEFIGRNGSLRDPAALSRQRLSGRLGAGFDPCAAIQCGITLAAGESHQWVFRLGCASDRPAAQALARRWKGKQAAQQALLETRAWWRSTLGAVQVRTPDPAFDLLVNGWLLYQTLACRLWGRSGFYQSGGAYGFRDQLQDVMGLMHAEPGLAREHLLRCAARQFREGDVQHWWHPTSGRGVRTRCSDDFLWLPLVTSRYVALTGDATVLEVTIPFLEGRPLAAGEESYFDLAQPCSDSASLYQHCVRALQRGLRFGIHDLPLMGSGDWNDGMNLVGADGRGESIWLGFFLFDVLMRFSVLAGERDDADFSQRCRDAARQLQVALEAHGWDGGWYRRAYFDDGTPLGSASNPECQIDAIAQSWAILSGAAQPSRAAQGMLALERRLVRRRERLITLLTPPFDTADLEPGYIKGYVPGVRENGGQYTHAAIWAAMAFAAQGDRSRAWDLTRMINPIHHASTPAEVAVYKVEPYVVAADLYAAPAHLGRGGWTWYTGSSAWLYRLMFESLLGVRRQGDRMMLVPCLPPGWRGFELHYRFGASSYRITVNAQGAPAATQVWAVDGVASDAPWLTLVDDGLEHRIECRGVPPPAPTTQ